MKSNAQRTWARPFRVAGVILASTIALAGWPALTRAADAPAAGPAGTAQPANEKVRTGVDSLIAHLHQQLQITPAQEGQFQKLAEVMRENAETMRTLAKKRADAAKTMTAMDDLKSYADISRAHAEDADKMVAAFEPLYNTMSDDQKKAADQEFREHYATHHQHHSH